MLRDTRTPIDGSSIIHAELQGLDSDDHKQYALTVGADRAKLNINNPQAGDILQYDSTSNLWYNTPGASTILIDSTSGDVYYHDPTRNKNLGIATIQSDAGRNHQSVTDQFLRNEGDTPTNQNGFVLPWNGTLIAMSMSGKLNTQTWTIEVRKNGGGVAQDALTITNQYTNYSSTNNVDFNAGERITIYCSGTSVDYPHATLFFRRRF